MSSPTNILEMQAVDSKLFIFGGINTLNKLVNDEGYHMFDARERKMYHIKIEKPAHQKLLLRSQNTCSTVKHEFTHEEIKKRTTISRLEEKICGHTHYIFGGEVWDQKKQLRVATNDLIEIK